MKALVLHAPANYRVEPDWPNPRARLGWAIVRAHFAAISVSETDIERPVDAILSAERVFAIGIGWILLTLQAFVKRLNYLGIPALFVGQINEPAIISEDLLIIGSGSGETAVPITIANVARESEARIVHLGSNANSSLTPFAGIFVRIPVRTKLERVDETASQQIMSSLLEQCLLLVGDAIGLGIAERKSITDSESLWALHANLG